MAFLSRAGLAPVQTAVEFAAVDAKRQQVSEQIATLQALDRHLVELKAEMSALFGQQTQACPRMAGSLACQDS